MGVFLALDLFLFFVFFEIVLVPMYFLIGGWGYGERRLRRHQVLPLHDVRLGVHARRHRRRSAFLHAEGGAATLTFDLVEIADEPGRRPATRPAGCSSAFAIAFAVKVPLFPLHTWLPDAHTEAPDGRLGDPRRRHAEARHLRLPALRPLPVPRGVALDFAPVLLTLGVDRHHLRRRRRHHAEGPQAAGRLLVGGPPRASSSSASSPSPRQGLAGRGPPDGQPRHLHRRPVPPGRHDLRAPPHPRDRRAARACRRSAPILAGVFTVVMLSLDRPARAQRLRRRVPDPASARSSPAAGGRSSPPPA